jgi:xylulose-5-phosphate/fructose-6-phosphate phosphoketolase
MVAVNDLDRFHLAEDVIDYLPQFDTRAAYLKRATHKKRIDHQGPIAKNWNDLPAISDWQLGSDPGGASAAKRDTAADNV